MNARGLWSNLYYLSSMKVRLVLRTDMIFQRKWYVQRREVARPWSPQRPWWWRLPSSRLMVVILLRDHLALNHNNVNAFHTLYNLKIIEEYKVYHYVKKYSSRDWIFRYISDSKFNFKIFWISWEQKQIMYFCLFQLICRVSLYNYGKFGSNWITNK